MSEALALSLRSIAAHERDHKGHKELAGVIESAADEIGRLRAQIEIAYHEFDAEKAEITGKLFDQINENKKLREQLERGADAHAETIIEREKLRSQLAQAEQTNQKLFGDYVGAREQIEKAKQTLQRIYDATEITPATEGQLDCIADWCASALGLTDDQGK